MLLHRKSTIMQPERPSLRQPIEIAKFWANRRGEAAIITLREFEGIVLIDVRKHYTAADGSLRPTSKGIALTVRKLPLLAAGITKALERARELELLTDGASDG